MTEIKGKNALEVWRKMLDYIMKNGVEYTDRRKKLCKEALNVTLIVENVEGITKPIEILGKFNKWTYPSLQQIENLITGKDDSSEYYYNYGERAFNYDGFNQVEDYVIPLLKKNPTSKRAFVSFLDPNKDIQTLKKEVPCLVMMNFNIREGKLHSTMIIRSNDMFHGWPGNIAQAYYLTKHIAGELNCPIGTLTTISVSAHIFEEQFDYIKKVLGKKQV